MSLGKKLKSLRLKENRTLKTQSELYGVTLNKLFRWEHDLAVPNKVELEKIAEFLGVPLSSLLQDTVEHDHIDQQLFEMLNKLSENQKYKILGYIERVYIEGQNNKNRR